MNNNKFIFQLLSFLLISGGLLAQGEIKTTLKGKVVDASGEPVPYIHIVLDQLEDWHAISYEDGEYKINNIPKGIYQVTAQSIGYKADTSLIEVKDNIPLILNFSLEADVSERKQETRKF